MEETDVDVLVAGVRDGVLAGSMWPGMWECRQLAASWTVDWLIGFRFRFSFSPYGQREIRIVLS